VSGKGTQTLSDYFRLRGGIMGPWIVSEGLLQDVEEEGLLRGPWYQEESFVCAVLLLSPSRTRLSTTLKKQTISRLRMHGSKSSRIIIVTRRLSRGRNQVRDGW
jgi:hypothetical protein